MATKYLRKLSVFKSCSKRELPMGKKINELYTLEMKVNLTTSGRIRCLVTTRDSCIVSFQSLPLSITHWSYLSHHTAKCLLLYKIMRNISLPDFSTQNFDHCVLCLCLEVAYIKQCFSNLTDEQIILLSFVCLKGLFKHQDNTAPMNMVWKMLKTRIC